MSEDDDYEVGKGRPPKATQFKKGKSGNPAGRPSNKRSLTPRQLRRDVLEIAEMVTTIQTARGPRKVTLGQALIWKLAIRAINDHGPSMTRFLKLYGDALRDHAAAHPEHFEVLEHMEQMMTLHPERHQSASDRRSLAHYRKVTRRT